MKNRFGKNLISFITVTAILSSFALTPMQAMAFDAPQQMTVRQTEFQTAANGQFTLQRLEKLRLTAEILRTLQTVTV